jgi:hypothetical protein
VVGEHVLVRPSMPFVVFVEKAQNGQTRIRSTASFALKERPLKGLLERWGKHQVTTPGLKTLCELMVQSINTAKT